MSQSVTTKTIEIRTPTEDFVDLTAQVRDVVAETGVQEGHCVVYVPHTTAGVTINENADPDVRHDLLLALNRISPDLPGFRHGEGNSAAHVKSSLMGSSVTVLVQAGHLVLGTWQGIYFCEFDGPRTRRVHVQVAGV